MGRHDQAIADYTRALAIRPGDPRVLARRGEAYLSSKQFAPGFADYEASLAADPDQSSLHNSLAWAYVTAPPPLRDSAKALTHARSAVRLSPENATHHNTLGVALYRLGRHREAVIELETSLAATSRELAPFDLFFLAMCHVHLGDTARARADLERARRLQAEAPLPAGYAEEIQAFRAEAEALLAESSSR
jgi:Tfp pilus assembly protein PilF